MRVFSIRFVRRSFSSVDCKSAMLSPSCTSPRFLTHTSIASSGFLARRKKAAANSYLC